MNMTCDQCGAENPADIHTCTPKPAPVQEPEATVQSLHVDGKDVGVQAHLHKYLPVGTKLYTTPPAAQRQWVGLTDEEIKSADCLEWHGDSTDSFVTTSSITRFARAIEAKLREKNGGQA